MHVIKIKFLSMQRFVYICSYIILYIQSRLTNVHVACILTILTSKLKGKNPASGYADVKFGISPCYRGDKLDNL